MITRLWRGWASADQAEQYHQHYRDEVLTSLEGVPGFLGARLLRRGVGDEIEFVSLTSFEDLDAMRSFAGPDYDQAVVAEPARKVLTRFDATVTIYETAFAT